MRTFLRLAVVVLVTTSALASPSAGQVTTTATLSISIDVGGADGASPQLGALEITPLVLEVAERACGGPTFLATFLAEEAADVIDPPAGVSVIDAEVFLVDVEVPATIDGTPCEYTVDPAASLLCYETVDVVADPAGSAQALSAAGVPTGAAVSPAEGAVVDVRARYTDRCADLRIAVDGTVGGVVDVVLDAEPIDPADASRTCDYADVGPSPVSFVGGVIDSRVAGCAATLTVLIDGCTVSPSPDEFVIEQPVTERAFTTTCAPLPPTPPEPVPEQPTFTG